MNPAFGGISAFLNSLVPALNALGHSSEIACLDSPDSLFLTDIIGRVHALGPVKSGYGYAPRLRPWLKTAAARFDAVIVHGLWQYHGLATNVSITPGSSTCYFVFPHGMLDPWFKRTYPLKHLRKWFYWCLAERRVLRGATAVLFTCAEESRLARQSFPGSSYRERVVTFGTAAPEKNSSEQRAAFLVKHPALRERPFWLFLARLHPKKGVDILIDAYAALCREHTDLPHLVIAGPCDDRVYLADLKRRAAASCPDGAVIWTGMLEGNVKWGALRTAEVFILPSHQENFGIAVVEALACGTPVLISKEINIWREILDDGAGLAEADTTEGTLRLMRRWRGLDRSSVNAMRTAALSTFSQRYEINAVAKNLIQTLQPTSTLVLTS
ncbi:glycosyltransferase [Oleiharenicola lentus]|uniref:glycosyltransferase n=1 Tax=Oleiharenicola lentus TaxID=2508720 RepID=UPI003F66FE18